MLMKGLDDKYSRHLRIKQILSAIFFKYQPGCQYSLHKKQKDPLLYRSGSGNSFQRALILLFNKFAEHGYSKIESGLLYSKNCVFNLFNLNNRKGQ